ncbi:OpgC domain-containing protein [uncultured Bartonella sp.]|uniref:OpgC family protein n=1 Tax=uncultured Bartonella sp. TaxID=104108 RepID=UPI003441C45F
MSKRDTRIDVYRALALLTIFVNHVPGTIYEWFTHKHFGFSDSAEAFVLISGISVGIAYGSKFLGENRLVISLKLLRRSATLYSAHILTTLASLAIFIAAATFFHHPDFLYVNNIPALLKDPAQALLGLVTLGHQLGYNNILSLYLVLILATPLFLFLASKSLNLLLLISFSLYLVAGLYGIAPHNYPTKGVWFLNPLSWQFLFVIGIAATIHVRRGQKLPDHPVLFIAAVGYLVLSLFWVRFNWWWINPTMGLPTTLTGFNKTFLSVPRLLHIVALAYVIIKIAPLNRLTKVATNNPLAILGKHSLAVFVTGTILAMAGQILKTVNSGGLYYDTLLLTTGIVIQFAVAYYFEWVKIATKDIKPIAIPAQCPAGLATAKSLNTNTHRGENRWQKA